MKNISGGESYLKKQDFLVGFTFSSHLGDWVATIVCGHVKASFRAMDEVKYIFVTITCFYCSLIRRNKRL